MEAQAPAHPRRSLYLIWVSTLLPAYLESKQFAQAGLTFDPVKLKDHVQRQACFMPFRRKLNISRRGLWKRANANSSDLAVPREFTMSSFRAPLSAMLRCIQLLNNALLFARVTSFKSRPISSNYALSVIHLIGR